MTNQEFADRIGCDFTMASRLRNGQRRPSVKLMRRIASEFNIPLVVLAKAHDEGPEAFGLLMRKRVFKDEPVTS